MSDIKMGFIKTKKLGFLKQYDWEGYIFATYRVTEEGGSEREDRGRGYSLILRPLKV